MIARRIILPVVSLFLGGAVLLGNQIIPNWPAPPSWTPPPRAAGLRPQAVESDISGPLPFIAVTPCRQYDSRNATPLLDNTSRTINLSGAPCGIPAAAAAVSVNITIFNIVGAPGNGVFRVGIVPPPPTAWINFPPTETQRANAGVVPTNGSGQIVVQLNMGAGQIDFTCDVNGYYAFAAANQTNGFKVVNNSGAFPAIWGETDSTSVNAMGIFGVAAASTGGTIGVFGRNFSNSDFSYGVLGISEGTTGRTFGVYGRTASASNNAVGVFGEAGGSGTTYGVWGNSNSTNGNAAGVYGTATTPDAEAGIFLNTSSGVTTYLCDAGAGLATTGAILGGGIIGTSLFISGEPKNFVAPHPGDPSKEIVYACAEAPTVDVYFRGTGTLVNGYARIEVPDHFRLTAREGTYMTTLTPVGRPASLGVESEGADGIVVRGSGSTRFHYVVYAERAEIEGYEPVRKNVHFTPEALEKVQMLKTLPQSTKALLIRNGTLNADGSYNVETARAMGWTIPEPRITEVVPRR